MDESLSLMGRWSALMEDVAACKAAETCPRLGVREYFSEPNPWTLDLWRSDGLYVDGIDRRVIFICESPSHIEKQTPADFDYCGRPGYRAWGGFLTGYDNKTWRFLKTRYLYGLENCPIVNVVKCGFPGKVENKPTDGESTRCSRFLVKEIELLRPPVIVLVGKLAEDYYAKHSASQLSYKPPVEPERVTHYSPRNMSEKDLFGTWEREFEQIRAKLLRCGLPAERRSEDEWTAFLMKHALSRSARLKEVLADPDLGGEASDVSESS